MIGRLRAVASEAWRSLIDDTMALGYHPRMVRHVDAIFSQGAFRPLEPLALREGARVRLSVEEETNASAVPPAAAAKIHTPKLAHPEDAADFVMDVRETDNAGV